MGIFGRGAFKDVLKLAGNHMATPFEAIAGQNLYNPELAGKTANKIGNVQENIGQAASKLVPLAASAIGGPGAGMAVSTLQGMNPNAGEGWDPNSMGAQLGNMASMAAPLMGDMGGMVQPNTQFKYGGSMKDKMKMPMGGMIPYGDSPMAGANLATFNGPSHSKGGIPFNQDVEIEKKETVDLGQKFVYSDELKVPGKKVTFAEESKKFKGSDKDDDITKNTNKFMLARLKESQEGLKEEMFNKEAAKLQKKQDKFMAKYGGDIAMQYGRNHYGSTGKQYGGRMHYDKGGPFGLDQSQINNMMMAAPAANAFYQASQGIEQYNPNLNEQYNTSIDLMSGRRYNAQPEIDAARRAQETAYRQGTESAGGSSALELANIGSAQVRGNRATQQALANEQNMNNQYAAQEAQMRANLGAQRSALLNQAQQMDMRAQAAQSQYVDKGFDYIGSQGKINRQDQLSKMLAEAGYGDLPEIKKVLAEYRKNKKKS